MRNQFYSHHRVRFYLFLAALLLFATPAWAKDWHELHDLTDIQLSKKISEFQKSLDQDSSDYEALKALGIAYHIKARKDAKGYAPRAVEVLSRAYEISKKDNETMCYLGSATTMMANATWNPIKKMTYVNKGTGLMDKAVKKDPDNISVRMTRASNSKNLPSFLNRGDIALEDFEYLAGLIEKNPGYLPSIKKKIYSNLAELYEKAGDLTNAERFRKLAENI